MPILYKKSYAFSARSEHPAHGAIGSSMGTKLGDRKKKKKDSYVASS